MVGMYLAQEPGGFPVVSSDDLHHRDPEKPFVALIKAAV
jgi:hypothetical protein